MTEQRAVAPEFQEEAEDQRQRNLRNELERRNNTDDMLFLLKQPQFLRYLSRWTKALHINGTVASPNSSEMSRREGRRMVAVDILDEVRMVDRESVYAIDRISNPTTAEQEENKKKLAVKKKGD